MPTHEKGCNVWGGRLAPLAFAAAAGLFFFIVINKFGNPVILDYKLAAPQDATELFYQSWPSRWWPWLVTPLVAMGLLAVPWKRLRGHWALALPAIWLGGEFLAGTQTVRPELTRVTLEHFSVCVVLFYLGCFALNRNTPAWPVWTAMALALCCVIRGGFDQHYGGLEATRKLVQSGQGIPAITEETLKNPIFQSRLNSNRIYSSFVYANALAGGLVLLMPLTLTFLWRLTPKVRTVARIGFVVILGGCGLACLYWSGSKAGWLVALTVGLVGLGHSALSLRWKRWLIGGVLIAGVAGFGIKYAGFFQKERNSVGARFAYWRAAGIIIETHPLFGTGPGTFQVPYGRIKRPDDEMARLTHNDYLEQGCDSGVFGMISYTGMIFMLLCRLYRYRGNKNPVNWLQFGVWLGLLGICLHSMVEFHLYIPALAWPMFFLFGWLFGAVL